MPSTASTSAGDLSSHHHWVLILKDDGSQVSVPPEAPTVQTFGCLRNTTIFPLPDIAMPTDFPQRYFRPVGRDICVDAELVTQSLESDDRNWARPPPTDFDLSTALREWNGEGGRKTDGVWLRIAGDGSIVQSWEKAFSAINGPGPGQKVEDSAGQGSSVASAASKKGLGFDSRIFHRVNKGVNDPDAIFEWVPGENAGGETVNGQLVGGTWDISPSFIKRVTRDDESEQTGRAVRSLKSKFEALSSMF